MSALEKELEKELEKVDMNLIVYPLLGYAIYPLLGFFVLCLFWAGYLFFMNRLDVKFKEYKKIRLIEIVMYIYIPAFAILYLFYMSN